MKEIFLIISVATFSLASAQENGKPYLRIIPPKTKTNPFLAHIGKDTFSFRDLQSLNQTPQLLPQAKHLYTLPNGNKIISLPQDNMPCVVPDMTAFNMPVVKAEIIPYTIPNPAYPPQSKIESFTPEKIKELQELLNKKLNK